MAYETIEIEKKDAGIVHMLVGTVTDVDIANNKVDVDIDNYGSFADIPVFYHCENSQTADGMPFLGGERVIIVNSGDAVTLSVVDMKVIGFEDGLPRTCPFYIDITINGKTPEYTKSLKIVDANDEEHFASSSAEEPDKVGPFQNIVWPAKIYLYYTGGAGEIFSYFKTPGEPGYYLRAKKEYDSYCREEWGRSYLRGRFGGSYTPTGDEEFVLSADRVEYLLHGTFSSKPISSIAFTTKLLGRLQTKNSGFGFGVSDCNSCVLTPEIKNWEDDVDSIYYRSYVSASLPYNCKQVTICPYWCGLCRGCCGQYIPSFESCSIGSMAIMTDENGHSPTFGGATVQAKYEGVWAQCFQIEILGPDDCGDWEYDYCYEDTGTVSGTRIWEWKMLPTPESRI